MSTSAPSGSQYPNETTEPKPPIPLNDLSRQDEESRPVSDTTPQAPGEEWSNDSNNPWNWPGKKKIPQVAMLCITALLATIGTSISSPATMHFTQEFHIGRVTATLPLTLFVFALGVGPVVGGPLSETIGRRPVYMGSVPSGALFALGGGFTHNFGALCFLRFMSGLCWSPALAVAAGSLSDLYAPGDRGLPSAIFLLLCFLGPGIGPVAGSFTVVRHGWRWTQWILSLMAIPAFLLTLITQETFHSKIKRRIAKDVKNGQDQTPKRPIGETLKMFLFIGLIRPLRMLLLEPIVSLICLYVAVEFGTLFSFFAGIPYTFGKFHQFTLEQSGLVFISVIIGCFLGLLTTLLTDIFLYRRQIPKYPPHKVPPEHRLYGAMIASVGLPLGIFWFAWTASEDTSWVSLAAAIIPFAWGNLCLFISTIQYISDAYRPDLVASAASANSLARYGFAAVFPLFIIQMLEAMGVGWGMSVFGFVSSALMPLPWVLFKFGPTIRAKSKYASS